MKELQTKKIKKVPTKEDIKLIQEKYLKKLDMAVTQEMVKK